MASRVATKYSILACQAMRKSAQKRRSQEQKTRLDDFRNNMTSQEEIDRIHSLAEEEVAFQRKVASTTKALKTKQVAWKSADQDRNHTQRQCSWTIDPHGWEDQQSGKETWETGSTLDASCQEVSPSEIQGLLWARYPAEETTRNGPSCREKAQTNHDDDDGSSDRDVELVICDSDNDESEEFWDAKKSILAAGCDSILPGEQHDVTDADPQGLDAE